MFFDQRQYFCASVNDFVLFCLSSRDQVPAKKTDMIIVATKATIVKIQTVKTAVSNNVDFLFIVGSGSCEAGDERT